MVANMDELKAAYCRLIQRWRPDRHRRDPATYELALNRAKRINAAYEYLPEVLEARLIPPTPQAGSSLHSAKWRVATDASRTRHTHRQRRYRTDFPERSVLEVFVKSSNIISVEYDGRTKILYIKFQGNCVYKYLDVSQQLFEDFLAAPSHGKFAHRHVYPNFRYERC